ncbi:MAG: hypothetical protein WCJ33_04770 [Pseudomonadota bacterium]
MKNKNKNINNDKNTKKYKIKLPLVALAAKAGMCSKTATKYTSLGKLPSELKTIRVHRTRADPFEEHKSTIAQMIEQAPELQAKTILTYLIEQYPRQLSRTTSA